MDPIEEDKRRSRRMKQYEAYQKHLDNVEGKKGEKKLGSFKGKKVETLTPHEDTGTASLFHKTVNKENTPR